MGTKSYASDLSDGQWALIEPHIPPARPGGRPRRVDIRAVVNAIFYLLRTGCQWRLLPKLFPPPSRVLGPARLRRRIVRLRLRWGTVWRYFRH